MTFKVSGPSAEHLRGLTSGLGAMLTGRRTFDVAQGWNGNHAWGPAFVLTHHVPAGWPRPNSTVHFVLDGIESAVNQAKAAAAGGRAENIALGVEDDTSGILAISAAGESVEDRFRPCTSGL